MVVGALIQARMGSRRLPGKALRPLAGVPMIQYLIERLERCRGLDGVLLATSDDRADDALVEFCQDRGIGCFRGDEDDVAGRLLAAAKAQAWDAFVRVNGDSPLLDPRLIERGVELFRDGWWDLVTNVETRTFPKGQSVEVLASAALERAHAAMESPREREHVTPYFYAHPESFRIRNFSARPPRRELQLSVDTAEDLERIAAIVRAMHRPHWDYGWEEIAALADSLAREAQRATAT